MRRATPLAAALALLPGFAAGQALVPCSATVLATRPDMVTARSHAAAIEDGTLRRVVLVLETGERSISDFVPMGAGVSVRLLAVPERVGSPRSTLVFNRAVVEPDGAILVETWVRGPDADAPSHNAYRLRCGGAAPRP
ncbi:hypothetical protein [Roseomonas rosulenta]|uniref:hypothetical protein n=1 Tax=Roseomonas rosulenta TaxID=2748667 RepID=UPI0018E03FDF|nr:hypothetical protein [Roseomonas rosulenta]